MATATVIVLVFGIATFIVEMLGFVVKLIELKQK